MSSATFRLWCWCFLFLGTLPALAQSAISAPHVTVSLVAENSSLQPGKPAWVGLRFQLEKGWHVYWINPGDSGEPPKVEWQLPPGFKAGELQFPFPHRLPLQTLMNFGYEQEVLYLTQITVPAATKAGTSIRLAANVRWMVCEKTCIPGKGTLELLLPASTAVPKAGPQSQLFKDTRARLPQAGGPAVSVTAQNDLFVLTVRAPAKRAELFPRDDLQIENAAPQKFSTVAGGFQLAVRKSEQLAKLPARIRGVLVLDGLRAYTVDLPLAASRPRK